jgi:hypothetical protein
MLAKNDFGCLGLWAGTGLILEVGALALGEAFEMKAAWSWLD